MFYAAFPPEFNSGRIYSGAGSGSLRTAAAAWDGLANDLQSTAAAYSTVISNLTSADWLGPAALAMAAAVAPYLSWMRGTATQAAEAATQASIAADAYQTAFAAHVPPVEIAANRSQFAQLVLTNIFGQNSGAIAATDVEYAEMWVQDAVAMDDYAGSSAAASQVTPFSAAPQVTSATELSSQATAAAQAAAGGPASALLQFGANLSTDYTQTVTALLNSLFGPTGASTFTALYSAVKVPLGFTTQFNDVGLLINFPLSQFLKFAPPVPYAALPKDALGAGLGPLGFGRGTLYGAVTGGMGNAGTMVGRLSVPPAWAAATPGIRTVAAALSAAGPAAVGAAELGAGGLLGSMSLAGVLGAAAGAGAPTVVQANVQNRLTPLKDLKDKHSPEQLQRLVAQISEKPESVQHHNVDQEGLDALLERLAKSPGIHAVHLTKGDKVALLPPETLPPRGAVGLADKPRAGE